MPLREDILNPIAEDRPSGENLYYSPAYDQIREARRQEDTGPQGAWERQVKMADYGAVVRLAQDAIATKTKDLQLAAWLGEALIYEEGATGLRATIGLLKGLIEQFWDTLYPELEDGDAEFRATPLEWFGNYFDPSKGSSPAFAVRHVALTRDGVDWYRYKEARSTPTEADASGSDVKKQARAAAIEEGKLTPEEVDLSFKNTPKAFYRALEEALKGSAEELEELNQLCAEKFADVAPGFGELRRAIEEVGASVHILLLEKLKLEPDAVEAAPSTDDAVQDRNAGEGSTEAGAAVTSGDANGAPPTELRSRQDAVRMLVASAQFLRRASPADPVPYLLVRALRWGELRSETGGIAATMLEAPTAETRVSLRNSASAGDWAKVLETAESAAAGGCGRGWLDLHRYTIRSCDELGYRSVARALRTGLKALLADLPRLPKMTLADDTGTANPETLAWLIQESLFDPDTADAAEVDDGE